MPSLMLLVSSVDNLRCFRVSVEFAIPKVFDSILAVLLVALPLAFYELQPFWLQAPLFLPHHVAPLSQLVQMLSWFVEPERVV